MAARVVENGQYFTPPAVVDFIWDTLTAWGVVPRPEMRILDPACGEGVFLRRAWERELCGWESLHGWDVDGEARGWWRAAGLPEARSLVVRDALGDAAGEAGFDLVIGNPPYGYPVARRVEGYLSGYAAWNGIGLRPPAARCPVELLFAERFARLARPGGWVAVILPEGLFVNARYQAFRDGLLDQLRPRAIVALPRVTFGAAGTSAKTAILFARRVGADEASAPREDAAEVLLIAPTAAPGRRGMVEGYLREALRGLLAPVASLSVASLRGHPWSPEYWDGAAAAALAELDAGQWPLSSLGRLDARGREVGLIRYTTYGAVGSRRFAIEGTRYLGPRNMTPTGVDFGRQERFVPLGGPNDPARSRLEEGDILLCNSGVASVGRAAIYHGFQGAANIAQHVNLIRVAGIDPLYVAAYLQTRFVRAQLRRFQSGTGAAGINFAQIRALCIPVPPSELQAAVRREYEAMHALHLAALAAGAGEEREIRSEQARARLDQVVQRLEALLTRPLFAASPTPSGAEPYR